MKKIAGLLMVMGILLVQIMTSPAVFAEGSKDLTANTGYRPYTEWYSDTSGLPHTSVMHVYLKQGETVCFGTSVSDAKLYNENDGKLSAWLFSNNAMGTNYTEDQLVYVNTGDIYVTLGNYTSIANAIAAGKTPGKDNVALIDLPSNAGNTTPGYLCDREQETGGADLSGTGTGYKVSEANTLGSDAAGYAAGVKTNANMFTAQTEGIYTVVFFSAAHTDENPLMKKIDDSTPFAETQGSGSVAGWDISVYDHGALQTGRVFTGSLYLNAGGNAFEKSGVSTGTIYSQMYAVTDDGYQYLIDLNGLDASEFSLYANQLGLLSIGSGGDSASLLHSIRSGSNIFSDLSDHHIDLNLGANYNLFFEKPSEAALNALQIGSPKSVTAASSDLSDFTFSGTDDTNGNEGRAGKGGTFSFTMSNDTASSYRIDLDFSSIGGGKVALSKELVSGKNSIYWNGKDGNGNFVPAGTYGKITLTLLSGETHLPLLDAEQNPNGIRIIRQNGGGTDRDKAVVYYNNSASNAGDTSSSWTAANWTAGDGLDAAQGVDSGNGAMKFTNTNSLDPTLSGDGDRAALDIWTYGSAESISLDSYSFSLVDTSFTANVLWNNDAGTPSSGNPSSVTLTLEDSGNNAVTTDNLGAAIPNPVTIDTAKRSSYTWSQLDPAKSYHVEETPAAGYSTAYSSVSKRNSGDFAQTVTNTYTLTTLKLGCIWNQNGETTYPAETRLHVYTDPEKQHEIAGSPYTLSADSGWSATISNLDPAQSYYVFEDSVEGYTISSGGKASGNAADGFASTFTNSRNDPNTVISQVLVQWGNKDSDAGFRPDSVLVTLYQDGQKAAADANGNPIQNPVALSGANSWYYAWTGLAKKTASGSEIKYSFSETSKDGKQLAGYSVTTEPEDPPLVIGNLTSIIFDNYFKTTSFTLNQIWKNGTGTSRPDSIAVQLQQSTDGGRNYANCGNTVTLSSSGSWSHQWTGLPAYTADNTVIQYRAVETEPEKYSGAAADVTGTADGGYSQTITSTYSCTAISVSDVSTGTRPASTKITLYRDGSPYDICTLCAADSWTYDFTDLPIADAGGNPFVYTVAQSAVTNYTTSGGTLTGNAANGYQASFRNVYQTTGFTAAVFFVNGIHTSVPSSAAIQLRQSADGGKTFTNYGEPVILSKAENWTHEWTALPAYNARHEPMQYLALETAPAGYTASAGTVSGTVSEGYTQTVSNIYAFTKLTVSDVSTEPRPASTDITLNKNGAAYRTCTLSASNGWTYVFDSLPITDEDGKQIVYTVAQNEVGNYTTEGGALSGNTAQGYTASFKNTYAPASSNAATVSNSAGSSEAQTPAKAAQSALQTGDRSGIALWSALLLLSGGALAALGILKKRKKASHR